MSLLQLKVQEQGRLLEWRPGQGGPWLRAGETIKHGDLTVQLSNGGGGLEVKVFKGKRGKPGNPMYREVIRGDASFIRGPKGIKRL